MTTDTRPTFQPIHLALLVLAVCGLLFIWFWPSIESPQSQEGAIPLPKPVVVAAPTPSIQITEEVSKPEAAVNQTASPMPSSKVKQPVAKLPSLDESDATVLDELKRPQLQAIQSLITNEYLIRKIVRAVVAASNGEWVNQHQPILPPKTAFATAKQGTSLQISEANFKRYTPYIDALESIGSKNIASLYVKYLPLLQQAYEELGLKDKDFHSVTIEAITQINTAPKDTNTELVHPSVMYQFKNKQTEALPEIQKVLIRMGTENQTRLKALLNEVKLELE